MEKILLLLLIIVLIFYLIFCYTTYITQEEYIFYPTKIPQDHIYKFNIPHKEINIEVDTNTKLNGLLFKSKKSKGVIFYLHGNGDSLNSWGNIANIYTDLNYDVFMIDYRGYGKSDGNITSEDQLHSDVQVAYESLLNIYGEDKVVVLGYSLGTGLAAKVAANNHPKLVILQAPYYSITDEVEQRVSMLPLTLLKYKLETHKYLKSCTAPVVIFHGDVDTMIDYKASLKLEKEFKLEDKLFILRGVGHNEISGSFEYLSRIRQILRR